jgi:biotin transporter BioY
MGLGYLLIFIGSALMCGMTVVRKEYQRRVDATLVSTITFMGDTA